MQNTTTYQYDGFTKHTGLVREKPAPYVELLEAKIEKYIDQLRNFELKCNRAGADREKLLDEITMLNDSILETCAKFERQVQDPDAIKTAQAYFREKTNPIFSKSYCINRVRTWPQGHQGDFMTLEINYRNTPLSDGIGYYLDRYFLSAPLAIAVRERLVKMRDLLKKELEHKRDPKVLDVACGSCREVFELIPEIKSSGAKFTCLDLDRDALDFARDRFSHAGLLSDSVELLTYNALRMFDYETAVVEFGKQDIIYSIGFFDYLPDEFLVKLLRSLYLLLNPDGKLIMAFKDTAHYRSQEFHWFAHWDGFMQRTADDFVRLLDQTEIPSSALELTRVESNAILFYTATKK
jgi:extracellular factor (EF) 3-hydroxypalmitic acid methyl ester biosynthesis protein